jgi:uncharacterized membrane protein YfcA
MPFLIVMTCVVGFLCGATSVGGVLLIPTLDAASDMGLRKVMGTVLLSFFFAGLVGAWMHWRAGRSNWRMAWPLCLGCLLFGYPGAVAKEYVSIPALNGILATAIIIAGLSSFRPLKGGGVLPPPSRARDAQLFLIGAVVAFLSAMTGAGGPVLSVPIMLLLGYEPLMTIAIAQPLQVAITFSGSVGNMRVGAIDYPMAALLTVLMMVGVAAGAYTIRFFKPDLLKKVVSLMCVGTGGYMLLHSIFG